MPNPAIVWAESLVDGLVDAGVTTACLAPGSRSTPLTIAITAHDDIEAWSILDERSAAFVALGRARRTGEATAVVTTSGTAVANCHPAVVEADEGRVPLLLLTADRPHELRDSGANQTIDQVGIFGDAPRWERDLPAPRSDDVADDRAMRSLAVTASRAVAAARGAPAGPVHLNCAFRKPLGPGRGAHEDTAGGIDLDTGSSSGAGTAPGRGSVRTWSSSSTLDAAARDQLVSALADAMRPLFVAGPAEPRANLEPVAELAATLDAPLLADPLSGLRSPDAGVAGGYAGYLQQEVTASWPSPDLVVRVGASPTSKRLRQYLRDADARDILVDPAGGWREATFTATDHVVASVPNLTEALADALPADAGASEDWSERFRTAERRYWDLLDGDRPPEAEVVLGAIRAAPAGAPVVLGNSTPIRDADRFLEPSPADRQLLGNRGASGIDGTISTAVGAATAADGPAVCVLGDLATLHDATGLSALERTEADCTIVVIDNDGGGIFHALPIAEFDPPFTDWFRTPHGSDLSELAGAVGIRHRVAAVGSAADEIRDAVQTDGPELVVVHTDAAAHHAQRDALDERVVAALSAD